VPLALCGSSRTIAGKALERRHGQMHVLGRGRGRPWLRLLRARSDRQQLFAARSSRIVTVPHRKQVCCGPATALWIGFPGYVFDSGGRRVWNARVCVSTTTTYASSALSLQEHQRQRVQNVQVTRSGPQCSERSGTARSTVCKLDHFTTASHLIKLVYHCKSSNQTSTRIAGAKGPVGAVGPAGCYMKGW